MSSTAKLIPAAIRAQLTDECTCGAASGPEPLTPESHTAECPTRIRLDAAVNFEPPADEPLRPPPAPAIRTDLGLCPFCGQLVEATRNAYRRVIGWEQTRQDGGTNQIKLRTPTGEWAHGSCIELAKLGGQTPLDLEDV